MQGTIAKLTVVAGVVGIGLLALLQVNGIIQNSQSTIPAENDGELTFEGELDAQADESLAETASASSSAPQGQTEPTGDEWEKELLDPQDEAESDPESTDDLFGQLEKSKPKSRPVSFDDDEDELGRIASADISDDAITSLNATTDPESDDEPFFEEDSLTGDDSGEFDPEGETASPDEHSGVRTVHGETSADERPGFESDAAFGGDAVDDKGFTEIVDETDAEAETVAGGEDEDSGPQLLGADPAHDDLGATEETPVDSADDESPPSAKLTAGDEQAPPFDPASTESADEPFANEPTRLTIDEGSAQPLNSTQDSVNADASKSNVRAPEKSRRKEKVRVVNEDHDPFAKDDSRTSQPLSAETPNADVADPTSTLPESNGGEAAEAVESEVEAGNADVSDDAEGPLPAISKPLESTSTPAFEEGIESEAPPSATPLPQFPRNEQPKLSDTKSESASPSRRRTSSTLTDPLETPVRLENPRPSEQDTADESLLPPQKIPSRNSEAKPNPALSQNPDLHGDATIDQNVPQGILRPHLTIEKVAPKNAVLGQPMVYQIIVKNQGDAAAHQVVVEDRIPRGSQLSGTDPQAVLTDRKLVWDLGTLEAGEERKIAVRVVPTSEGSIGSVATVNFVAEVTAETLITAPKLELELTGPQAVDVGETVELHFKLTNMGNSTADAVFIREVIPAGFEHPSGDDLEYEVGGLSPGQSREVDLKLKAVQPGHYINRAIAMAEGGWEVETKLDIDVVGPQFTISRDGPKRRTIGRSGMYSNTIQNNGDRILRDVSIEEALPEGMEFVEASDGGQYNAEDRVVIWRLDELLPQAGHTVSVVLTPRSRGAMESTVRVVDSRGIPVEVQSLTDVVGHPSLSIDTTALDGPINVGEEVGFRVQIRNRGTAPATNLDVRMTVPPGLQFVAARGLTQDNVTETQIRFVPVERLDSDKNLEFELVFRSVEPGDSRVKIDVTTDQMQRPLSREEAVVIFSDEK
ncbi:MAG: hypothetical protein WEB58_04235 [Planctomycetaceae bacterium]